MERILASLVFMVLLLPALALGETMKDLVERAGLFYKEFTDVPFTGNITGKTRGTIRNGKKNGPWVYNWKNGQFYWNKGQLWKKGTYRDGKKEGLWVEYSGNGQLFFKGFFKGTYKDDKKEGLWVYNWNNGQLWKKETYQDGKLVEQ